MKRTFWITIALFVITACTIAPIKPLDQQLAETTNPAERKETLRLGCLNEADWPAPRPTRHLSGARNHRHGLPSLYVSEVRDMKVLCRQMDELTDSAPVEKLSPKILAGKCAEQIAVKSKKQRKGNAEHIIRIQKICDEMTGQKSEVR